MWSMMVPAVALPRHSQLAGIAFQVCLINTSSQCTAAVAKLASRAIRKQSVESEGQGYHICRGGQCQSATGVRFRRLEVYISSGGAEDLSEVQGFDVAFHCENRGNRVPRGTKSRGAADIGTD